MTKHDEFYTTLSI